MSNRKNEVGAGDQLAALQTANDLRDSVKFLNFGHPGVCNLAEFAPGRATGSALVRYRLGEQRGLPRSAIHSKPQFGRGLLASIGFDIHRLRGERRIG